MSKNRKINKKKDFKLIMKYRQFIFYEKLYFYSFVYGLCYGLKSLNTLIVWFKFCIVLMLFQEYIHTIKFTKLIS